MPDDIAELISLDPDLVRRAPKVLLHDHLKKTAPEALLKDLASREAFGRAAETWEIANVIVFLASDYSSYLTGEVISASSQRA